MISFLIKTFLFAWASTPLFQCELPNKVSVSITENRKGWMEIEGKKIPLRVTLSELQQNGVVPGARMELRCRNCKKSHPKLLSPIILGIKEAGATPYGTLQYEIGVDNQRCRISHYQKTSLFESLRIK